MKTLLLLILATAMFALCSSSPDAVDDFNRISSSLSQKNCSEIKITEEKRTDKVEMNYKGSHQSAFSSQSFHEGHNLFFQPQILIGSGIDTSFLSNKVDHKEYKEQIVTGVTVSEKNESSNKETLHVLTRIPDAPVLSPLEMPKLPTPVIVEETILITPPKLPTPVKEIIFEQDTVVIPKLPTIVRVNPPIIPVEVILPKPLPHVPTCLDNNMYGITIPCPPTIAVSPGIIGINKVEKTLLINEVKPILNLRVPKIPLGVVYNKPVKTMMPYPGGFISTTRFLPSVKVSKIPLERLSQQNLLIFNKQSSEVVVEKIHREKVKVGFSPFSAYCAHNIAIERVLPNIIVRKEAVQINK